MKNKVTRYRVLIVGAGDIAAFYDTPESNIILTHAHAITKLPELELIGFVDKDINKARKAAKVWNTKAYEYIDEIQELIDIICCAVSDDAHYEVLKGFDNKNIRAIVAEKPITKTIWQAREIVKIYKNSSTLMEVNYSRRFTEEFVYMKNKIKDMGELYVGTGYYGKGMLHNASHLVDLLCFCFNEVSFHRTNDYINDFSEDDISADVILRVDGKSVFLHPINCQVVTVFELDLLFENGRIRYNDSNGKIEIYKKSYSELYRGEINYRLEEELLIDSSKSLINLYKNVISCLQGTEKLISPLNNAIKVLEICESSKGNI